MGFVLSSGLSYAVTPARRVPALLCSIWHAYRMQSQCCYMDDLPRQLSCNLTTPSARRKATETANPEPLRLDSFVFKCISINPSNCSQPC